MSRAGYADLDGLLAPRGWSRQRVIASIAIVTALGVALAIVVVGNTSAAGESPATGPATAPTPAAAPTPAVAPSPAGSAAVGAGPQEQTPTGSPSAGAAGGCPATVVDAVAPTAGPTGAEWELVGTVAVPRDSVAGPAATEPVRGCFARSPTGAALAAANIVALSTLPPSQADEAILSLTAQAPGRELLEAAVSNGPPRRATAGSLDLAGFSLITWTADESAVDLALLVSEPGAIATYVSVTMTLRWEDGDWRLVPSETTGNPFMFRPLPSLAGYVPWART